MLIQEFIIGSVTNATNYILSIDIDSKYLDSDGKHRYYSNTEILFNHPLLKII